MVNIMLRSLSCVFCHAVWGGMFAYFRQASSCLGGDGER